MAQISENVELTLQRCLLKATIDYVDGGVLYTTGSIFRYLENNRHITGGCASEAIEKAWRHYVPDIIWSLFSPKRFVLVLPDPLTWDNDTDLIPEKNVQAIVDKIEQSLMKRFKRYAITREGQDSPMRMR